VRFADTLAAAGQLEAAIDQYERALRQRPPDGLRTDILVRLIDAWQRFPPAPPADAFSRFQLIMRLRRQVLEAAPWRREAVNPLLEAEHRIAQLSRTRKDWQRLLDDAERVRSSDAGNKLALKLSAFARIELLDDESTVDAVQRPEDDLRVVAAEFPNAPDVALYRARCVLFRVQKLHGGMLNPDTPRLLEAAANLVRRAAEQAGADAVAARLALLEFMLRVGTLVPSAPAEAETIFDGLIKSLSDGHDPDAAARLADLVLRWSAPGEDQRTFSARTLAAHCKQLTPVLEAALAKHPDHQAAAFVLGRIAELQDRIPEAARRYAEATRDRPCPATAAAVEFQLRKAGALFRLGCLALESRAAAAGIGKEKSTVPSPQEIRESLEKIVGSDSPLVRILRGREAMQASRLRAAIEEFAAARKSLATPLPELLYPCAVCLADLDVSGAAGEWFRDYLQVGLRPKVRRSALERAINVLFGIKEYDAAAELVRLYEEEAPGRTAERLQAEVDLAMAASDAVSLLSPETVARLESTFRRLAAGGDRRAALDLVTLFELVHREDEAAEFLRGWLKRNPDDLEARIRLLRVYNEVRDAAAAAALAAETLRLLPEPDAPALPAPESAEKKDVRMSPSQELLWRLCADRNAARRAFGLARYFLGAGDKKRAERYVQRAIAAAPFDGRVWALRLALCDADKDPAAPGRVIAEATKAGVCASDLHFLKGVAADASGRLDKARAELRKALDLCPPFPDACALLGRVLARQGKTEQAEKQLREALELAPDHPLALRELFNLLDRQGRRSPALQVLRKMALFEPNDDRVIHLWLNYLDRYGALRAALEARRRLATLRPQDNENLRAYARLLMRQRYFRQAEEIIQTLRRREPDERRNLFLFADLLAASGREEEGRRVFREYLQRRGDKADAEDWLAWGRFLRRLRDPQSIEAFRKAAAGRGPAADTAMQQLAALAVLRGNREEAIDLYRKLIDRTRSPVHWIRLIGLLLDAKRFTDADTEIAKLEKEHGPSADTWLARAALSRMTGKTKDALDACRRAMELSPDDPRPWLFRVRMRFDAADEQVERDLEEALKRNPNLYAARELRARLELQKGRLRKAIKEYRLLCTAMPGRLDLALTLADLLLRQGMLNTLDVYLSDWRERWPDQPEWHWYQARLALAHGRIDEAAAEFTSWLNVRPGVDALRQCLEALLSAGRPAEALALIREHESLVSKSGVLQAIEAQAVAASGDVERAEALLKRIVSADELPDDAAAAVISAARAVLPSTKQLEVQWAVLAKRPDDVGVRLAVAETLAQAGRTAEAQQLLDAVPSDAARDPAVLLVRAEIALAKGDLQEARTAVEQAVKTAPDNPAGYLLRARMRLRNRDEESLKQARKDLEKALVCAPNYWPARELLVKVLQWSGENARAESELRRLIESRPGLVRYRVMLADLWLAAHRTTELAAALPQWERALPGRWEWLRLRGLLAEQEKRPEEAARWYQRWYDATHSYQALEAWSRALMAHAPERAVEALTGAAERFAEDPRYFVLLGRAQTAAGRADAAERSFARAVRLVCAPGIPLRAASGVAGQIADAAGLSTAVRLFRDAAKSVDSPAPALLLGDLLLRNDKQAEAVLVLERLTARADLTREVRLQALLRLGAALHRVGENRRAAGAYQKALTLLPEDPYS